MSATIVCCYEIAAVTVLIVSRAYSSSYVARHDVAVHPQPAVQLYGGYVSYCLALCAALLLWRMNRAAVPVLTVRAALTLALYIFILSRVPSAPPTPHALLIREITHAIGLAIVLLNAFIAWHVDRAVFAARPSEPAV